MYTLEKVLKMKRDTISQVIFLDEAMKVNPIYKGGAVDTETYFFSFSKISQARRFGRRLGNHWRSTPEIQREVRHLLSSGRFLIRLRFHLSAADAQYRISSSSPSFPSVFLENCGAYRHRLYPNLSKVPVDYVRISQTYLSAHSPETVLVLRALTNFESLYVARSSNKLNEAVGQAFSGGARSPPGMNEGVNIARTVANELDSARFDPLLVRSVAKNVGTSLDLFLSRIDGLVSANP